MFAQQVCIPAAHILIPAYNDHRANRFVQLSGDNKKRLHVDTNKLSREKMNSRKRETSHYEKNVIS